MCSKHQRAQDATTLNRVLAVTFGVLAGYYFFEKCSGESSNGEDAFQYNICVALSICVTAIVILGAGTLVSNIIDCIKTRYPQIPGCNYFPELFRREHVYSQGRPSDYVDQLETGEASVTQAADNRL